MQKETFLNNSTLIKSIMSGKTILRGHGNSGICTEYALEKKLERAIVKLESLNDKYGFKMFKEYKKMLNSTSYDKLIAFLESKPKTEHEAITAISVLIL